MKNFNDFQRRFDFQKFVYDLNELATPDVKEEIDAFTSEQSDFVLKIAALSALVILRQYDAWQNENRRGV